MKKYIYIAIVIVAGFFTACVTDDVKPTIVQTENFNATVAFTSIVGDTIGIVPGTSNKGSVRYTIDSQTPAGIFTIGETYGELIVASTDVASLAIGSAITLQVSISNGGVSQTSNVEIIVVPPPPDVTPWVGTLVVTEDFGFFVSVIEAPSADLGGGLVELSGGDPFDLFCSLNSTVTLKFEPLISATATEGVVTIESQTFLCNGGAETIEGTGVYNIETKEITLDYTFDGNFSFGGSKVITPKE